MIELKKDSDEWRNVENQFRLTMQESKVHKIERIQERRRLWTDFLREIEHVKHKNNGEANLGQLFHGIRWALPSSDSISDYGVEIMNI
jgi:hypothetical protein